MLRFYVFAVWRNWVKHRSGRRAGNETPAMRLGLADRRWSWSQVLARRQFPDRVGLDEMERKLCEMRVPNPELPSNTIHSRKYAS